MARTIIIAIGCTIGCALLLMLCKIETLPNNRANMSKSYKLMPTNAAAAGEESASVPHHVVNSSRHRLLVLHRQKRYLLFPEGSSFQLVFDLIIPIVDYTNFAILGITCAIAWELPSKPPSEILENLRTRLNDGTLGTVRRNDSIQKAVAADNGDFIRTATNWQAMHAQPTSVPASASASASPSASASTYASNVHSNSYYTNLQSVDGTSVYANSPNGQQHTQRPTNWHSRQSIAKWRQWADSPPAAAPAIPYPTPSRGDADSWADNWWQRNKARIQQNWRENQQQWTAYEQPANSYSITQKPRQVLREPPKHHIYPVFGKRRRRRQIGPQQEDDDFMERLHLRQHLSSRGLLFGKIERLYKSRQLNGTACVQRALCESAQRHQRARKAPTEPQSFIMELLSAIFQLPSNTEDGEGLEHILPHYLEAHQEQGNCRQIYGDCNHTFWFE